MIKQWHQGHLIDLRVHQIIYNEHKHNVNMNCMKSFIMLHSMKKLNSILFALFVAIFFTSVLGCGKDLREQFTEACQNQDFELAHQILDKYKDGGYGNSTIAEDAAILLKREGTYLLENNTEADTEKLKVLILETPDEPFYRYEALEELFPKAVIMKNNELIKFMLDRGFLGIEEASQYFCENGTEEELLYIATFVKNEYGHDGPDCSSYEDFEEIYSAVFTKCLKSGYFSTAKEMIELLETTKHTKLIPIYKKQYDRETKK